MPVTPSGPISLPLTNLQTLLANCPSFQTWTGTANANAAAARIHLVDLTPPADGHVYTAAELATQRPLACVDLFELDGRPGLQSFVAQKVGDLCFVESGKLVLTLEAAAGAGLNIADAKLDFANKVGAIIEELLGLASTNGYLTIHKIEILVPIRRADQTEQQVQGDFFRVLLLIDHGI